MRNTLGRLGMARTLAAVLIAAAWLLPSGAMSQDVAVGSATATVYATLTVTSTAALDFGNVYQGIAKTIANNNAAAGVFRVSGQASSVISIYMQLPEYLQGGVSNDRMVISFSTTDASVDSTGANAPTGMVAGRGWQNINPHAFPAAAVIGSGGNTDIYLGGKVIPSVNQTAGAYSADVVLTVAYTGS
ncbi:MAG: hypothetical protein AB1644_08220 [Candidatus Zixiibacteriota bacterium]